MRRVFPHSSRLIRARARHPRRRVGAARQASPLAPREQPQAPSPARAHRAVWHARHGVHAGHDDAHHCARELLRRDGRYGRFVRERRAHGQTDRRLAGQRQGQRTDRDRVPLGLAGAPLAGATTTANSGAEDGSGDQRAERVRAARTAEDQGEAANDRGEDDAANDEAGALHGGGARLRRGRARGRAERRQRGSGVGEGRAGPVGDRMRAQAMDQGRPAAGPPFLRSEVLARFSSSAARYLTIAASKGLARRGNCGVCMEQAFRDSTTSRATMSPRISIRLLAAQSDQRLLALVDEGHERAFEALVQRYRRPLLRYCRRMGLSERACRGRPAAGPPAGLAGARAGAPRCAT